jgi:hypothetical protein
MIFLHYFYHIAFIKKLYPMSIFKSILIVILIVSNLASCATSIVWKNKNYAENFKHFLTTKDGKKVVILGEKYHYIFDDESGFLIKLLSWDNRLKLEIADYKLKVINFNKITGSITINTKPNVVLNEQEISYLRELDFIQDGNFFKKDIDLFGTRYSPKTGVNYNIKGSFSKDYSVRIEIDDFADTAKKIAVTPITIVADGIYFVVGATLIVSLILVRHPLATVKSTNSWASPL